MQAGAEHHDSESLGRQLREPDEIDQVDRSLLLDLLDGVKSVDSMAAVRRAVADIRERLLAGKTGLPASTGDAVAFGREYLLSELDQIVASRTLERARYYLERLEISITQVKTSEVNDINLNRWKEYPDIFTDSLWIVDRRDNSGVHTAGYWGNFIPQIPNQMIRRYTKGGEWVLDTFAGAGTTLIEGQRLGRHTIGIELQAALAEQARHLVASEPNEHRVVAQITTADSAAVDYRALLAGHHQRSVQLIIMHPPYFDIIRFSDDPGDLSNAASVDDYMVRLGLIVEKAGAVLDEGRYLVLVIGDKYARGEWIPLGFLAMNEVLARGFSLKSIVVKNFEDTASKRAQKELWRYRALAGGFYVFKHEYIFLFQKGPAGA